MPIFTVHEPPSDGADSVPERFAFVRDGFHVWAALLTPLWMLWHRLWAALAIYLLAVGVGGWALSRLGVSSSGLVSGLALVSLLVGLEAPTLRRWTFARRRWRELGVVAGHRRGEAERRFFDAWTRPAAPAGEAGWISAPARSAAPARRASAEPGVIGLFPEPGGRA